jgi:hypothetical protein
MLKLVNLEHKDWWGNKPGSITEYIKYIKCVDRADEHPHYHLVLVVVVIIIIIIIIHSCSITSTTG